MGTIDNLTVRRIKEAADIVDVVGDFVELRKSGVRYLGLCPFHEDRHLGSFVVYPKGNVFRCFACDAKGGAIEFLMRHERLSFPDAIRYLGKKYSIETDMQDFNYTPPPPRPKPEPLPMLTIPMWMVERCQQRREENTLVRWLRSGINWDSCQRKRIDSVLNDYHVGSSRNGMAMFWQIDEQQQVHTGKMMLYKTDGHRDKAARYGFDWMHSVLYRDQRQPYSDTTTEAHPCLFGLHLLDRYKRELPQQVCIVESEKTALIMAIAYGNNNSEVWMACGGIENLTREKLKPIIKQRRNIVLYPDRDGIAKWKTKAAALHYENVLVDTKPVTDWWKPDDGPKADIADVVVRSLNERAPINSIGDIIKNYPDMQPLIQNLNLTIANENR